MGLFSSKKKTIVSASIYNLAGDKIENFIRQTVLQNTELGTFSDFPKNLVNSILESPGFKLRRYFYWCQNRPMGQEYLQAMGYSNISFGYSPSNVRILNTFKSILNLPPSQNVIIDSIEMGDGDFYYWGAKYLSENYPQYLDETLYDFEIDYNYHTNEIIINILDINNTYYDDDLEETRYVVLERITFPAPSDYDPNGSYLYIAYQIYDLVPIYKLDSEGNPTTEIIGYKEPEEIEENLTYLIYSKDTPTTDPNYNAALSELFESLDVSESRVFLLPPIPLRHDNRQISSIGGRLYQLCKWAAYKAFGDHKTYRKLNKAILENPSIGDLDYVYIFFGVSINTKNWAGKAYLYDFMAFLYNAYLTYVATHMLVQSISSASYFRYRITWSKIEYGVMGTGTLFPTIPQWARDAFGKYENFATYSDGASIYFIKREKLDSTQYTFYKGTDMHHYNLVHKGKEVHTSGVSAFNQATYDESPFIFPIHEGIYKSLPSLTQAQFSMSFSYLIFNVYKRKKVKWYQRGIFKVIVVVVIVIITVVVTVVTKGAAAAPASKLGAALSSSLVAAGVGTVAANMIALVLEHVAASILSTIIAKIVTKGAQELGLGNAIANIAGVIAGAVAMAGIMGALSNSSLANTSTVSITSTTGSVITETTLTEVTTLTGNVVTTSASNVASTVASTSILEGARQGVLSLFTSPVKLIGLSLSITDAGVKGYYADTFASLQRKAQKLEDLQNRTREIEQELAEFSNFTEWSKQIFLAKVQTGINPDDFMEISFMYGSDIADITIDYLTSCLDMSRNLTYPA